jgi:hypothetical protein
MKDLSKVLAIGAGVAVVGAAVAATVILVRRRRTSVPGTAAGTMSTGAVDEVQLAAGIARPMRGNLDPESFDPEEVPSEHPEINELREKMPFG